MSTVFKVSEVSECNDAVFQGTVHAEPPHISFPDHLVSAVVMLTQKQWYDCNEMTNSSLDISGRITQVNMISVFTHSKKYLLWF